MKTCNHEGCTYKCFGGGYCRYHQRDRKDKTFHSPRQSRAKPKPIRKLGEVGKAKRKEKAEAKRKDHELWQKIWNERPHVDFETGEPIFGEALSLYFHHVLPKQNNPGCYPQFRYKAWNIILLSWDSHAKAEADINLVPKVKAYRDYLIKKYAHEQA